MKVKKEYLENDKNIIDFLEENQNREDFEIIDLNTNKKVSVQECVDIMIKNSSIYNDSKAELLQISFLKKVYKTIEEINIKEGFKNLSEYERDIINNILHMFLIKLFTVNGKYINKSERKIIDKLIVVVNYDIKRIEKVNELVEQSLYFLNHLTSKKILIKTKKKYIYYRLNKEYIEELEKNKRN